MTDGQTDAALRVATDLFRQLDDGDRFSILQYMNKLAAIHRRRRAQIFNISDYTGGKNNDNS